MKVGVLCEFSGIVRDAFINQGHAAISFDLLPTESPGPHIIGDCLLADYRSFDLLICHPPCTHLSISGARWFKDKKELQEEALNFIRSLLDLPVPKICLENPVGIISSRIRKPDQIIQPWQFGHTDSKKTCLWLKNLPLLEPTEIVEPEYVTLSSGKRLPKWYNLPESKQRSKIRSVTFKGIAEAMAKQWGEI